MSSRLIIFYLYSLDLPVLNTLRITGSSFMNTSSVSITSILFVMIYEIDIPFTNGTINKSGNSFNILKQSDIISDDSKVYYY